MPEVISNTTPFQYLHQIGCLDCLSHLYQRVIVPQAVVDELRQGKLKGVDVPSLDAISWVIVEPVALVDLHRVTASLDSGERETLALAIGKFDPLLILDDAAARAHARALGLRFTGTLGVLMKAKQAGLIAAIGPCLDQLDKAGFYFSANVRAKVLTLAGETP
jgi:predicted nucleic acid-binding protein